MPLMQIEKLNVSSEGKNILKNINMKLDKGKIYALLGSNGSGKSTLANVIIGNPKYKANGKIIFNGKDILELSPDKRAKEGIFVSFQNPMDVPGINIFNFLRTSYNSMNKKMSLLEFKKMVDSKLDELGLDESFVERNLNENLSGGERKKLETLQMIILNPKLIVLDEIDSGLDRESLKNIVKIINKIKTKENSLLIISHYDNFIEMIKPDVIFKIKNGEMHD